MSEPTTPGQTAFEAYNLNRGGKTHDGKDTPTWDKLTDGVRDGWEAAAIAVEDALMVEQDHSPSAQIDRVIAAAKTFCNDSNARDAAIMRLTQAGEYIRGASSWGTPQESAKVD